MGDAEPAGLGFGPAQGQLLVLARTLMGEGQSSPGQPLDADGEPVLLEKSGSSSEGKEMEGLRHDQEPADDLGSEAKPRKLYC